MKHVDDSDYVDAALLEAERDQARAELAAMRQLAMLILDKAGGKVTITQADIERVQARNPDMVRWPLNPETPDRFEMELIDDEGRPWQ